MSESPFLPAPEAEDLGAPEVDFESDELEQAVVGQPAEEKIGQIRERLRVFEHQHQAPSGVLNLLEDLYNILDN